MDNKEEEYQYSVKATHEFFAEISKGWNRFKRGAIMSTIVCSILLIGFIFAYFRLSKTHGFEINLLILLVFFAGFLIYTIYLMTSQYRFFKQWEKRMKRIYNYEEALLADDENKEKEEQTK
ncbi:MAG: hypothetical protein FWH37_02450 [Candidatus Bathyarchaeota archaeon]|nr:hypothetical protein [Candidatus Termiticorpusculum sp.]